MFHPELYALGYTAVPDFRNRTLWGDTSPRTVKEAGLPNITGSYNAPRGSVNYANTSGAIVAVSIGPDEEPDNGCDGGEITGWTFDASRCSSIYGKSTTVQPPALTTRFLIKAKS